MAHQPELVVILPVREPDNALRVEMVIMCLSNNYLLIININVIHCFEMSNQAISIHAFSIFD